MNVKQQKKSIWVRFLEWIIQGNKKAAEKGELCPT
jgi:hypothetical protein